MTQPRPTRVRYLVLASFCAAAAIAYAQRNGLGVAKPLVTRDLGIDDKVMGFVMGSFFVTYALVQIPAGLLAKRWRTRRALTMYAVLWSMSTAAIALAPNWWLLAAAQLAMGAAQAGLFPACTLSLTDWMPATRRGMATGLLASFMSVGAAAGSALAGLLLDRFKVPWQGMFVLYAVPGVLWAACFQFWFRDDPAQHVAVNDAELDLLRCGRPDAPPSTSANREPTPWLILLTSPAMLCICGQHLFRSAGYFFYPNWFPSYLRDARGVSLGQSGWLTSIPIAAVVLGSPLGGTISDWLLHRTGSRRIGRQIFASVCMLLSASFILAAWQTADTRLATCIIAAGSFCAALGGPCAYAITMDMGGRQVAAVFSTMNAVGSAGAFTFTFVVPWIVAAGGWNAVMITFAGIYLAAACFWLAFDSRGTIVPGQGEKLN